MRPANKGEIPDSEKDKYLQAVREYIKYFVGEDAAKLVKKEDLCPLTDFATPEQGEPSPDISATTATESLYFSKTDRMVTEDVDFLFEADTPSNVSPDTQPTKPTQEPQPRITVGYGVMYAIDIAGEERRSAADIMKRKAKGLFGGLMADLRNIEIKTLGGGSIGIGKLFDPDKWKAAMGIVDLDIDTVDNHITNVIKNDMPRSNVNVNVWDRKALINFLNERGKITPEVRDKINEAPYSVVLEVRKEDASYHDFNKQKVADICTRAFGTSTNLTNFMWGNKITPEDVILISDIQSKYKQRSAYDMRRPQSNDTSSNSSSVSSAKTKESMQTQFYPNPVDKILAILFEDVDADVLMEKKRKLTHLDNVVADFRKKISRCGSKNILGAADTIRKYADVVKFGDGSKRGVYKNAVEEFLKLADDTQMDNFVSNKARGSNDDRNALMFLWKCVENADIPAREPEDGQKQPTGSTEQKKIPPATGYRDDDSPDKYIVDMYIVPSKRLTSKNRKNQNAAFDDGTVRAKPSNEPYKPEDMRM